MPNSLSQRFIIGMISLATGGVALSSCGLQKSATTENLNEVQKAGTESFIVLHENDSIGGLKIVNFNSDVQKDSIQSIMINRVASAANQGEFDTPTEADLIKDARKELERLERARNKLERKYKAENNQNKKMLKKIEKKIDKNLTGMEEMNAIDSLEIHRSDLYYTAQVKFNNANDSLDHLSFKTIANLYYNLLCKDKK